MEIRKALIRKLSDDELTRVSGGRGGSSKLDEIMNELSAWLDAHPNAAKSDVYSLMKKLLNDYSDELSEEELEMFRQLLDSFES